MPATDQCEAQILQALYKQGWYLLQRQYHLRLGKGKGAVFADLLLGKPDEQNLIVEVKCFSGSRSQLDQFYHALGQYLVYQQAIKLKQLPYGLYIALPSRAYRNLSRHEVVLASIRHAKMKLILVDLAEEQVEQWIRF